MKPRLLIMAAILLLGMILLYFEGFLGSSAARLERDHSILLPASASHIRCEGPVSLTFTDTDAAGSFEIAARDLPSVLSQFTWQLDISDDHIESLSERMNVPPAFAHPSALQRGVSRDGNFLYLQSYDLGNDHIGICVYTMWN